MYNKTKVRQLSMLFHHEGENATYNKLKFGSKTILIYHSDIILNDHVIFLKIEWTLLVHIT